MNLKSLLFSNQDLINATMEIYNSFEKKTPKEDHPDLEIPQKINIDEYLLFFKLFSTENNISKKPITKKV